MNGVVNAISGETGKVIDIKVMTKFCRCKGRLEQQHNDGCVANYEGRGGGMEVQGILEMFRESEAKYGIRYKHYLGDGDSSAFSTVEKSKPCGPDFVKSQKECIGHV